MAEEKTMNTEQIPAEVFPPGEFIREEIEERGWTQEDLAEILGRPLRLVNEIIMGKRGITPETANGIAAAFGTSAQFWMNLESMYRLSQIRTRNTNTVERRARLYSLGPIKEMIKRHWLEPSENINILEQRFMEFTRAETLDIAPTFYAHAARKSTPYHTDTPAQTAWLYRARQVAEAMTANRYSPNHCSAVIEELRNLTSDPEETRHAPRLLANAGIRLLVVEPFRGSRIDGACFWLSDDEPVVAISMRYDRIDYFWHTLMHELEHVKNQDGLANLTRRLTQTEANELLTNQNTKSKSIAVPPRAWLLKRNSRILLIVLALFIPIGRLRGSRHEWECIPALW